MMTLNDSDFQKIAKIVADVTGNLILDKHRPMLESRMSTHLLKLGLKSMTEYWSYYGTHEDLEKEALQSLMTTHHTFFFREFTHFEVLENWIEKNVASIKDRFLKQKTPLRIWSAASSRGQEAYSIAMFLEIHLKQKHGIDYEIVGTDIDRESVAYAKNGVYPIAEVNKIPRQYLNGFWKRGTGAVKDFAALQPSLKSKVRFEDLNLVNVDAWQEKTPFDVIFVRNVFIYFSEADVKKIALSLMKRLHPEGLFISGVSEPLRFAEWPFENVGASSYIKRSAKSVAPAQPVAPVAGDSAALLKSLASKADVKKYKVLCVDDSATIQALMKKLFSQDPLCEKVDSAVNGKDARAKLDAGVYDLITLDIHMPEVNGIEFLERLYDKKKDPPVIMVSSVNRTDVELATKSLSLGAFDYIEKPAMNNLQKSKEELFSKVKMALRSRTSKVAEAEVGNFDASIAQKIVVPDASQCLRIVVASTQSLQQLEQVIRGQKPEYRSPPLLVLLPEGETSQLATKALEWTDRSVVELRETQILKPNHIYFKQGSSLELLKGLRLKSLSLQVLDTRAIQVDALRVFNSVQILLDERVASHQGAFELSTKLKVSDVTPATSFPSLSVEFFASLRKAAA